MKKYMILIVAFALFGLLFTSYNTKTKVTSVDHSDMVSGPFDTPQDVTRACLGCHEEQGQEVLKSRHWLWLGEEFDVEGKGKVRFGKKNSFNNSLININSNESSCTSCHAGYGWNDSSFDFTNADNIDCLVCHDQSGTYKKNPSGAGMPFPDLDLVKAAQSVGRSTRQNCTHCHYAGGSGMAPTHGDHNPALTSNSKMSDVHLKAGFECTNCHKVEKHKISGAGHSSTAQGINSISCTDCHDDAKKQIHKNTTITKHLTSVACESCHIPNIAQDYLTLTHSDWSSAGLKEDVKLDENHLSYSKQKGDQKWEKDVTPVFLWHNGKANYYMLGDKISDKPLQLNKLDGNIADAKSKIYPFKLMRGKQIYDTEHNYLIVPKLIGEGGFYSLFDWQKAAEAGMNEVKLAYSGKHGFIETEMLYPINHKVAGKGETRKCNDCHGSKGNFDWKALGYNDDPLKKGGRVKNKLVK